MYSTEEMSLGVSARAVSTPEEVEQAIGRQLQMIFTGEAAAASWRDHGAVVIAPLDQSPQLVECRSSGRGDLGLVDCPAVDRAEQVAGI